MIAAVLLSPKNPSSSRSIRDVSGTWAGEVCRSEGLGDGRGRVLAVGIVEGPGELSGGAFNSFAGFGSTLLGGRGWTRWRSW